jgi:hypothetical protein
MAEDESCYCERWSEPKLYEAIDQQIALAIATHTPGLRLGHLASARALLSILADRAQFDAANKLEGKGNG